MALICCLDAEPECICEKDKVCGGVHVINAECVPHAAVQYRCTIHEIGAKRIEVVE